MSASISDVGLKLIIAEWDPAFAAATPHPGNVRTSILAAGVCSYVVLVVHSTECDVMVLRRLTHYDVLSLS